MMKFCAYCVDSMSSTVQQIMNSRLRRRMSVRSLILPANVCLLERLGGKVFTNTARKVRRMRLRYPLQTFPLNLGMASQPAKVGPQDGQVIRARQLLRVVCATEGNGIAVSGTPHRIMGSGMDRGMAEGRTRSFIAVQPTVVLGLGGEKQKHQHGGRKRALLDGAGSVLGPRSNAMQLPNLESGRFMTSGDYFPADNLEVKVVSWRCQCRIICVCRLT
mmetsp:Transcript_72550/g.125906  ORF Transcript_72550/g.125906 Transcript_72550/m.125906 type:complete len:218 (-) Transcript_72550:116-769(-)